MSTNISAAPRLAASHDAVPSSRLVLSLVALWFLAAVVVGASGVLAAVPFPGPQILIVVLTLASIAVGLGVAPVRASIEALSLKSMVGFHAIRFVGIAFLVLAARGLLSPIFAERAGWGDIITAAGAVALVASGAPTSRAHRAWYLAWNIFGTLDLVVVVITAAWIGMQRLTPGLDLLLRLPLSLLPTFFVPLLLASHVVLFRRLRNAG